LCVSLCLFLGPATLSTGAQANTIVLKAITVFPVDHPVNRDNQAYVDEINKWVKGELG
jgi:hypothetical protein